MTEQLPLSIDGDARKPSAEFKLSITRALADQLAVKLKSLQPAPLDRKQLSQVAEEPGVYELYLHGKRVYVGKTSKNLRERLGNHLNKLTGRTNISISDVRFICLYVDEDLEAAAPEKLLIKKYRDEGGAPWNTMGFGNKDPGRRRDHSLVKAQHFDAQFPIDLNCVVRGLTIGTQSVESLLNKVKAELLYLLRFETKKPVKKDLRDNSITITSSTMTARQIIQLAVEALPEGWQATALPGYVVLYNETEVYESAKTFWRKQDGKAREFAGQEQLDFKGNVIIEEEGDGDEAE